MKDLEKQLQEQMRKSPHMFIKQNAGKPFEAKCPACGIRGEIHLYPTSDIVSLLLFDDKHINN